MRMFGKQTFKNIAE